MARERRNHKGAIHLFSESGGASIQPSLELVGGSLSQPMLSYLDLYSTFLSSAANGKP